MSAESEPDGTGNLKLRKLIGLRIVSARKRRGWNQEALARKMGVSRRVVGRWERGIYCPSLEALVKLALVLEAATDELLLGKPAPRAQIPPAQRSEAAGYLNGFLQAIGWPLPAKGKAKRDE
jgi:transcriptional regulator with XRE-family HTH domain